MTEPAPPVPPSPAAPASPAPPERIRFDGQVAVVTGAGRGLGAAYARLLGARGAAVVVHDAGVAQDGSGFDPEPAEAVAQAIAGAGGTALPCHENLEDGDACRRVVRLAVQRFGRIDALIHNAGLVIFAAAEETRPDAWARMVALNAHAPFHLVQEALPHMRRQGYGRIVLTTSGRAMRVADCVPGLSAYCMGKMAQFGLMIGLAAELAGTGIRANAVSPVAATRVLRRHAPDLLPEAVAPGVAFLASAACGVSGAVLRAAGGRFALAEWDPGREIDLGPAPATPEAVAARWREMAERR